MTEESFTTSAGVEITWEQSMNGSKYLAFDGDGVVDQDEYAAIREYIIAQEDKRLGRWRWPENPEYVVYPEGDAVRVLRESVGTSWYPLWRGRTPVSPDAPIQNRIARAYFDANPEPKPWEFAKPGEIWALGISNGYHGDSIAVFETDQGVQFVWGVSGGESRNIPINDRSINYGTRIWPAE